MASIPPRTGGAVAAAMLLQHAAQNLSARCETKDRNGLTAVVFRMQAALDDQPTREKILAASPFVIELSGREKTLVEMVENEPGDDLARLRLMTLLLRALIWHPAKQPATSRIPQASRMQVSGV